MLDLIEQVSTARQDLTQLEDKRQRWQRTFSVARRF